MTKANLSLVAKDKSCAYSGELETFDKSYENDCSKEIINLHDEILRTAKSLLPKVLRVWRLLVIQKKRLPHGQFTAWIKENLPFSPRTAQHYMKVFRHKKEIKSAKISVLGDAYNLLKSRRIKSNMAGKSEDERSFLTLSLYPEEKEWIEEAIEKAKQMLETDFNSRAVALVFYDWLYEKPRDISRQLQPLCVFRFVLYVICNILVPKYKNTAYYASGRSIRRSNTLLSSPKSWSIVAVTIRLSSLHVNDAICVW